MKSLQTILQRFICVGTLPVLEFDFIIFTLAVFVNELANEKRYKPVEGIFLIGDIIMAQDLLKAVYNIIFWRECFEGK